MKKTMDAAEFKAKCLSLLDSLRPEGVVITMRGRPIAKLIPVEAGFADLIGVLKGRLHIRGRILSTRTDWDAQS